VVKYFPLLFALACSCFAQKYYTYIGNLGPDSVLIAWGTTDGTNTIGRSSPSHGEATVRIAGRSLTSRQNWIVIGNLKPDTDYPYEVLLNGKSIAQSSVRTWASAATKLIFFVVGDYGNGSKVEWEVAKAMFAEFQRRAASGNPPRFLLTTGDNIYGDLSTFIFGVRNTGTEDSDWGPKFFAPYEQLIQHIPVYPTLGNHDGNETENRRDLPVYLDNFFFPGDRPARYYQFSYGGLADFFGLDSTLNTESGAPSPAYLANGAEFQWMQAALTRSTAPWKIPYYHHPVFNAGPRHVGSYRALQHWMRLFQAVGVKVVFNGHEHNFQFSEVDDLSGGVRYVTSGAGGELRGGNATGGMRKNNIAGWTAQNHFLVVEIDGKTMRVTPLSWEPVHVTDPNGQTVPMPLTVTLP
jgi:tartrate-resistant acid phosphatase type 5